MGILLGLAGAVLWGFADFAARFSSRRIGAYRTMLYMQALGFLLISPYVKFAGDFSGVPRGWHPWLVAIFAGAINTVASLALYRSFETGVMTIVAPVSASYPALTAALAFWSGERIGAIRGAGLAVTFLGVLLAATAWSASSSESQPEPRPANPATSSASAAETVSTRRPRLAAGVGWAIVAAVGFGFMFWFLGFYVIPQTGSVVTVWVMRATALGLLLLFAAPARQTISWPRGSAWWLLLAVAFADTSAFIANNFGLGIGPVSIVSVLVSLYGAVTVVLSWIFLRERLARSQWFGIFLIFAGIVLVSV
jgi:drug/metabolite transporter (DMT)-like permease